MSTVVYPKALEAFLSGSVDLTSATVKAALVTSSYTYSSSHQYYSSVSGVVGTPQTLGSKTVTSGEFGAADSTWSSVAAGSTIAGIVVYKDTGSSATSPLLAFIDKSSDFVPLGVVTNGGNITAAWSAGKVFKI